MPPLPKALEVLKKFFIRLLVFLPKILMGLLRVVLSFLRPFKPRIYFCYDQSIHQIHHTLFVALELSRIQDKFDVVILSTSYEATCIIEEEMARAPNRARFVKIRHPGYMKVRFNVDWFVFYCALRIFKPAAVVVSDYYDNVFRQLGVKTVWIFIPHGVANRAFSFDPHLREYDMVFLPGEKDLALMQEKLGALPRAVVSGYSKLDYLRYHKAHPRILFKDKKPVVLYNPHFEKELSSFFDGGMELLEALSRCGRYNVIFMPHPDLARKHQDLVRRAKGLIGIAVIERPKINLDYMATSDVYITDISSSVFEWFYFDKPAVFFNTKGADWKNNVFYTSWHCGRVAETIDGILDAIDHALRYPDEFREKRQESFRQRFHRPDRLACEEIAGIIYQRLCQN